MINKDRIVPVTATDLISLYGLILLQDSNNADLTALEALNTEGDFSITDGSDPLIASEPVSTCDVDATASSVSAFTLYFVPTYDYAGFSVDGTAVTTAGADVEPDGRTLYKAVLSSGTITISQMGF